VERALAVIWERKEGTTFSTRIWYMLKLLDKWRKTDFSCSSCVISSNMIPSHGIQSSKLCLGVASYSCTLLLLAVKVLEYLASMSEYDVVMIG
jgi:hypothetical protein